MELDKELESPNSFTFLWARYQTLQAFFDMIERVSPEIKAVERRHEFYLRKVLDETDFENALMYVDSMADFCELVTDAKAADLYRIYRNRVVSMKSALA